MSDNASMKNGPSGYLVVLPKKIIEIPLTSNLSWLPLFYALPRELVNKRPKYMELPRNINFLLSSPEYVKMIEADEFPELVWDCYAWSIWQFLKVPLQDGSYRDIPGDWSNYSGDFPLWRLSYYLQIFFREKFEYEIGFSFQSLFLMQPAMNIPWLDYHYFSNLIGNMTVMIVKEQNLQPTINEVWRNRQIEDYTDSESFTRKDFMKHWTHVRKDSSIKAIASLDELLENNEETFSSDKAQAGLSDEVLEKIEIENFKKGLSEEDKQILQMRADGRTLREIAAAVGMKSPSAITKRIAKLADHFHKAVS